MYCVGNRALQICIEHHTINSSLAYWVQIPTNWQLKQNTVSDQYHCSGIFFCILCHQSGLICNGHLHRLMNHTWSDKCYCTQALMICEYWLYKLEKSTINYLNLKSNVFKLKKLCFLHIYCIVVMAQPVSISFYHTVYSSTCMFYH